MLRLVAALALAPVAIARRGETSTCLGKLRVSGETNVEVTLAGYDGAAQSSVSGHAITTGLNSRIYLADECVSGSYASENYASWKLLGHSLSFTVDFSNGAECGCDFSVYLTGMAQNTDPGTCGGDYYCDAAYLCGQTACTEIDLMEANQHAWHSTLHVANDQAVDSAGSPKGLGGDNVGEFSSEQYGIGGSHIDTRKPFNVTASFPVNKRGSLVSINVTLSQLGGQGPLAFGWAEYSYYDKQGQPHTDGIDQLHAPLAAGLTPVISYWNNPWDSSHQAMQWLDGGVCATDDASSCSADGLQVSNFKVNSL